METRGSPLVNLGVSGYRKGLASARLVEEPQPGGLASERPREASLPAAGSSWPYEGLKTVLEGWESKGLTGQLGACGLGCGDQAS